MGIDVKPSWNKKFKENVKNQQFDLFLKRRINAFLKSLNQNSKILDLGCGNGEKAHYIGKLGFNVVGIDASEEAINYAKKNFPAVKFYKKDALSTKFKENSFDAIISIAVFHCFLEKDRKKYIKEINRILKKRGLIFQLVLSYKDETMKSGKEIENNTFLQKLGTPFHLFTKKELEEYFHNFKFFNFKHHKKLINKRQIAVYTMTLRKE